MKSEEEGDQKQHRQWGQEWPAGRDSGELGPELGRPKEQRVTGEYRGPTPWAAAWASSEGRGELEVIRQAPV